MTESGIPTNEREASQNPMDPDFSVEQLSLDDIEFEAGFWFRKCFPAICTLAWILLLIPSILLIEMSEPLKFLLFFGGTILTAVLAGLVTTLFVFLFPKPGFFLGVSCLWFRIFKYPEGISLSRLTAMRERRKQLLLTQNDTRN